jgi:methionyl-tRNA formyltransferase
VVQALAQQPSLVRTVQPEEGVCYAHKIEKREAAIDWTQSAGTIVRRIRAFNPFPGAATQLGGESLKVWSASVSDAAAPVDLACGSICALAQESIAVVAMNSVVNIHVLQRPGGKRLPVAEFLRGADLQLGMVFEAVES